MKRTIPITCGRMICRIIQCINARAGVMESYYRRAFILELQQQGLATDVEADVGVQHRSLALLVTQLVSGAEFVA